jgi:hypothetical protein
VRWAVLHAFFASCLLSQTLNVYSEFARIDTGGRVIAPESPREILSPAIVRNGFTSFQIVVEEKPGEKFALFVGLNPPDAVKVTLYRESGALLEPVELPFHGEGAAVFWMDVWCDRAAPVRRVKIEPELSVAGDWARYPMEARVMEATVPDLARPVVADLREFLCGRAWAEDALTGMHQRNGRQDAALAQPALKRDLLRQLGDCHTLAGNPEVYLRVRDYLLRVR